MAVLATLLNVCTAVTPRNFREKKLTEVIDNDKNEYVMSDANSGITQAQSLSDILRIGAVTSPAMMPQVMPSTISPQFNPLLAFQQLYALQTLLRANGSVGTALHNVPSNVFDFMGYPTIERQAHNSPSPPKNFPSPFLTPRESPPDSRNKRSPPARDSLVKETQRVESPVRDRSPVRNRRKAQPKKKFTCDVCNRSFSYKHVLHNHERTHTGEKPFKCEECGRKFTRDHHLKTHTRLHTGERPYQCEHCSKSFVQVANLRRHNRTHTGEKPFVCKKCNMSFADSNQRKSHDCRPTIFRCPTCPQTFNTREASLNHTCVAEDMHLHTPSTSGRSSRSYSQSPISSLVDTPDKPRSRKKRRTEVRGSLFPPMFSSTPIQTEPEDLSMRPRPVENFIQASISVAEIPSQMSPPKSPRSSTPKSPMKSPH